MNREVSQKFAFDDFDDGNETRDVCRGCLGRAFLVWWLFGGCSVRVLGIWFGWSFFLSIWRSEVSVG